MIVDPKVFYEFSFENKQLLSFLTQPVYELKNPKLKLLFNKIDLTAFLYAQLQNALHKLLSRYINGDDYWQSRLNVILPLKKPLSDKNLIHLIKAILKQLKIHGIDTNDCINITNKVMIDSEGAYEINMPKLIKKGYCLLESYINGLNRKEKTETIVIKNCDDNSYTSDYLQPISKLKKTFDENSLSNCMLFIHGSLAAMDYVKGLSDCDTLIIIEKSALYDRKSLVNIRDCAAYSRSFLYLIDPLQHHGHFVITEIDFNWYPQHYFPINLFDFSVNLYNGMDISKIAFLPRDDLFERFCLAYLSLQYLKNSKKYFKKLHDDAYKLKFYLQSVQMIPIYLYQLSANFTDKKKAIETFGKLIVDDGSELIRKCSLLRKKFSYDPLLFKNIAKLLIPCSNPYSQHRRAVLFAKNEKYIDTVNKYIGDYKEITAMSYNLYCESMNYLKKVVSNWNL